MDTLLISTNSNTYSDGLLATIFKYGPGVLNNNFQYTSEVTPFECLNDDNLTKMAMAVSQGSLSEDWDNEDDAHWEGFLKK